MAPTPTPVPVAQSASFNTFSGTYIGSGVTETSGVSGNASGIFEVITQDLTITYFRMPRLQNTPTNISLSADPTVATVIHNTDLWYEVRANYRKTYEVGQFSTSSFVQNQRFRIVANEEDQYGNSYGDLSAGGSLTLGPAGVVVTETPYYARRLVAIAGADVVKTTTLYNRAFKRGHYSFNEVTDPVDQASDKFSNTVLCVPPQLGGTYVPDMGSTRFIAPAPSYVIQGVYGTAKETEVQVKNFVDDVGRAVANSFQLYDNTPTLTAGDTRSALPILSTNNLPEYDPNRHSWV